MPKRIALLRAVNVAGQGKIKMAALKTEMAAAGFSGAQTLLASGNVVFDARGEDDGPALEALLLDRFELSTRVLIRDLPEWSDAIADNPFEDAATERPNLLLLYALSDEPTDEAVAALAKTNPGPERLTKYGRHLLVDYADGVGTSKLTLARIERALGGLQGTGRNWNTVLKLAALLV